MSGEKKEGRGELDGGGKDVQCVGACGSRKNMAIPGRFRRFAGQDLLKEGLVAVSQGRFTGV